MLNKINWKIRFMNKKWVITFIAAIIVLITAICKLFGFELDLTNIQENIVSVVYAIFGVLTVVGIVSDPTTEGWGDSTRAQGYTIPGGYAEEDNDEFTGNRGSV